MVQSMIRAEPVHSVAVRASKSFPSSMEKAGARAVRDLKLGVAAEVLKNPRDDGGASMQAIRELEMNLDRDALRELVFETVEDEIDALSECLAAVRKTALDNLGVVTK